MKGGAWKNSEDEILKAAVMKYGKTEWARVASLLPRKSAKHCKARWEEWLDPRIKKTEWTREEDEKLMHLAKVLAGQWRTISSMMDRTAFQCCERYEKLLDLASREEGEDSEDEDDPRLLRSGEIDPHPESRPARPDPVDMDEDEIGMIQEARARLANTQGKKAKRKMREKEMELNRRLASNQKRREMRAAGIDYRRTRLQKKGEIDWNMEVPFQKEIPAGYYDISNEVRDTSINKHFTTEKMMVIEHNERKAEEERRRKKDIQRFNRMTESNLPEAMMQLNRLDGQAGVARKRAKLSLPAPVVSEAEINAIINSNEANEAVAASRDGSLTSNLLTPAATPLTALRTPLARDVVMEEAKNQLALQATPTPLQAGNAEGATTRRLLAGTGFEGMTPATGAVQTPATPFTPATPGLLQSASKKPSRVDREEMRSQFAALPAPQNEYGVSVPEEEETEAAAPEEAEDVEAIERQIREEEEAMEKEELARRSEVLKRGLPRGNVLGARFVVGSAGVEKELKEEVNRIVAYEDFKYPSAESTRKYTEEVTLAPLAREDRLAAEVLVMEEEGDLKAAQAAQQENTEENSEEAFWRLWLAGEADLVYDPAAKEVVHASELTEEEKVECYRHAFSCLQKLITKQTKLVQKSEKKLNLVLGGYLARQKNLVSRLNELHRDVDMSRINYLCFSKLAAQEQKMLTMRLKDAKERMKKEKERHAALQKRYKTLLMQIRS
ncbi:hypothetical protein WA577_000063 [Blastocystis sp. JDR]